MSCSKKEGMITGNFCGVLLWQREEVQLDMESFDYISYCLGLSMYGNMPLVEPLEYTEACKLEEIVIAIDTSSSCSREMVQRFLEETYSMLSERVKFFQENECPTVIQCDCYIQEDVTLCCEGGLGGLI